MLLFLQKDWRHVFVFIVGDATDFPYFSAVAIVVLVRLVDLKGVEEETIVVMLV